VFVVGYLAGIGLIGASFAAVGHGAEHGSVTQLLVVVHVLGVMWWVGALMPLWLACRGLPLAAVRTLMHRFGQLAVGVLATLLLGGGALLVALLDSPSQMFTSPYGLALSAKLGVVLAMLGLAALHKWRLVPGLIAPATALRLQISVGVETGLAALVLAVSAVLSTLLGPAGLG
jgi:putative copper resistance protein D